MTYLIQVTQDDINQGERSNNHRCPIARAWLRATGFAMPTIPPLTFQLPIGRILHFDKTGEMEPFAFKAEV